MYKGQSRFRGRVKTHSALPRRAESLIFRGIGSIDNNSKPLKAPRKSRRRQPDLLRSPRDMLHSACSTEYFPLTLTLSLREREQQASDGCLADGCWPNSGTRVIERRRTILPLPWGEGRLPAATAAAQARGEGNRA